jgi:predicted nucleic-acid-binding protein
MTKREKSLPDTNVIVRYLTRDVEALYIRAKAFFDAVKDGRTKAIILESVIAESVYVLTKIYAVPGDRAARSLIDILRYKGIANDDRKALIRALSLFSRSRIDMVDCLLCVKAAEPERALFSFDRDFIKASDSGRF